MTKTLPELVEKIKYLNRWTNDQVAKSIKYTRGHLQKEMRDSPESSPLIEELQSKFKDILDADDATNNTGGNISSPPFLDKYVSQVNKNMEMLEQQNAFLQELVKTNLDGLYRLLGNQDLQNLAYHQVNLIAHAKAQGLPENTYTSKADKLAADMIRKSVSTHKPARHEKKGS